MNDFHLLATVNAYPRTISKDPLEIRIKAVNIRDAWVPGQRTQHLSAEIPLTAYARIAEGLLRILKKTRYVIFSGHIDMTETGRVILVATKYTHLPGRVQQAESYIDELRERGEILQGALPVDHLLDSPGKITIKNPESNQPKEW